MPGKMFCVVPVSIEKAMSAIIQALTTDGFVVFADGRSTPVSAERPVNDKTQKIFDIGSVSGPLCMATVGSSEVETVDGLMDITKEFTNSACILRTIEVADINEYGSRLAAPVYAHLSQYSKNMEAMEGQDLFNVFIQGFLNGSPGSVRVRLFFQNGTLAKPEIILPQTCWRLDVHGADNLARSMFWGTGYTPPTYAGKKDPIMSVADVTAAACAYISACGQQINIEAEPFCAMIGGHIHGAVVGAAGFQWIDGFKPVNV